LVKNGDYFGMPATEAARLCDQAPADGILISPATRMLAGRVDGARFQSFGELELKGISEPMEAFKVLWEPLDPERAGAGVGRWPFARGVADGSADRIRGSCDRARAAPARTQTGALRVPSGGDVVG
jgi:hypothetical protein